ncbi:MAG: hypothetical protein HC838_12555 [Spirulinaceae cyanobacterium RM2_2_10]|nr:hypothetical protein [Spirulinaceae cyanobacterium SM2_1_0]NJO20694.1 hypothetical protein [Spirulinaceae cyanobacterium RM2_2_10]
MFASVRSLTARSRGVPRAVPVLSNAGGRSRVAGNSQPQALENFPALVTR